MDLSNWLGGATNRTAAQQGGFGSRNNSVVNPPQQMSSSWAIDLLRNAQKAKTQGGKGGQTRVLGDNYQPPGSAPDSGSAPGGGLGALQVTTGIDAGPVWGQNQVQGTQDALRSYAPNMPSLPGSPQGLPQQFQDILRGNMSGAATNFGRGAAQANAQQQLASEGARAGAGVNWAQLLANQQGGQMQIDALRLAMLLNTLGGISGGLL